ncbi:unnamed protein product [Vitrella brassicaformis CCMP3155]|uniref:Uncharacterized protein n=1 Tax=Vitrella brassicaformis (strain CCMP3155) TaxID=1169540 RepID=A0A0G4G7D9_VITBC|nr:unnamed protein product [Vitrella brassicaformis CCMP3155]|eukprot:CEM24597.1 unnamed protein product [Vitrella brassicaformis CCMP3155]
MQLRLALFALFCSAVFSDHHGAPEKRCRKAIDKQRVEGIAESLGLTSSYLQTKSPLDLVPPSGSGCANAPNQGCCQAFTMATTKLAEGVASQGEICSSLATNFTKILELASSETLLSTVCDASTGCYAQAMEALKEGMNNATGKGAGCAHARKITTVFDSICKKDAGPWCLSKYAEHLEILETVTVDHAPLNESVVNLAALCANPCWYSNTRLLLGVMGGKPKDVRGNKTPRGKAQDYKMMCARVGRREKKTHKHHWNKFVDLLPEPAEGAKGDAPPACDMTAMNGTDMTQGNASMDAMREAAKKQPGDKGVKGVAERLQQIQTSDCEGINARIDEYGCCAGLYYQSFVSKHREAKQSPKLRELQTPTEAAKEPKDDAKTTPLPSGEAGEEAKNEAKAEAKTEGKSDAKENRFKTPEGPAAASGCKDIFTKCPVLSKAKRYELKTRVGGLSEQKLKNNCVTSQELATNLEENMEESVDCEGCEYDFCVGSYNLMSCQDSPTCTGETSDAATARLLVTKPVFLRLRRLQTADDSVDVTTVIQTVNATDDGLDTALEMAEASGDLDAAVGEALDETTTLDTVVEGNATLTVDTDDSIPTAEVVEVIYDDPTVDPLNPPSQQTTAAPAPTNNNNNNDDDDSGALALSASLLPLALCSAVFVALF